MEKQRPDPDELLARVQAEEASQVRGKLKIFFGPAAGVGKTYAMLEAAHQQRAEGVDVVVGYVETHGRVETQALMAGLEQLPPRLIEYHGTTLTEFDVDAALARHPTLILVDELAHTNAPGLRHPKRWQFVQELLQAGINVYTTLNVQHIESLNDVVAQITGIQVRETVPDWILEQADEVELIDLAPDELLARLREGKVYVPAQAQQAIRHFFRKGNLIALRELALRRTAARVDQQMQGYMQEHGIPTTWPAAERVLVCISPSPLAISLVRRARRMAGFLHGEWHAVYVETPAAAHLSERDRDRVFKALALAEQLGAQTAILQGQDVASELLAYARQHNVSQIVVGKPLRSRWRDLVFGSTLDQITRVSGPIDVYVVTGESQEEGQAVFPPIRRHSPSPNYLRALAVVVACTLLAFLIFPYLDIANLIMLYLLGVVAVAAWQGRGPAILATVLSVLAFDFFFVPPYLTFAVSDTQYLFTFGVMLIVALVTSSLTVRIREQAEAARLREQRTAALYGMSRELAKARGRDVLIGIAVEHIARTFGARVAILVPDAANNLVVVSSGDKSFVPDEPERGVAEWVLRHGENAGPGTDTLPSSHAIYQPLVGSYGTVGVVGILSAREPLFADPEQRHLLETFANQTALAIERSTLAEEAERSRVQIETERLRNSLLSSVSHDLRTPLATISGASESLLSDGSRMDEVTRRELLKSINDEAERLNRLIRNLLNMTRLESGAVQVNKESYPLEEIVEAVLSRVGERLESRPVAVDLAPDLPLIPLDSILIEQALTNLMENALRYTPPSSPIEISARVNGAEVLIQVADRGPGLPAGDEKRVFDKFYHGAGNGSGVGLGLAICRGIVQAHGGQIWAQNREGGGAIFTFTLPLTPETGLPAESEVSTHA